MYVCIYAICIYVYNHTITYILPFPIPNSIYSTLNIYQYTQYNYKYRVCHQKPDAISKHSLNKADIWKVVMFTHTSITKTKLKKETF